MLGDRAPALEAAREVVVGGDVSQVPWWRLCEEVGAPHRRPKMLLVQGVKFLLRAAAERWRSSTEHLQLRD